MGEATHDPTVGRQSSVGGETREVLGIRYRPTRISANIRIDPPIPYHATQDPSRGALQALPMTAEVLVVENVMLIY